jgi:pimeloyl-ACP methyl ester carboxylesterase
MSPIPLESSGKVKTNNLKLYYEAFGNPSHPAVLLIIGLASQSLQWFPYFYEPIVQRGYYVIRFDNRDIGLSDWIDPTVWEANPYSLEDMAADAIGLLDGLKIEKAHIIGASMGGAIAQRIAISYPNYVRSRLPRAAVSLKTLSRAIATPISPIFTANITNCLQPLSPFQ